MHDMLDTLLLIYLCVTETVVVYKLYFKPKRVYNRKSKKPSLRVYSND